MPEYTLKKVYSGITSEHRGAGNPISRKFHVPLGVAAGTPDVKVLHKEWGEEGAVGYSG